MIIIISNSSTASGNRDLGGAVGPSYRSAFGAYLYRANFTSFHILSSQLAFFHSFILFRPCCSHGQVFGTTFVHDSHVSIAILNRTSSGESNCAEAHALPVKH